MTNMKNKKFKFFLLIQILIMGLLFVWIYQAKKDVANEKLSIALSDWQSDYATYTDGVWTIDAEAVANVDTSADTETSTTAEGSINMLYGPYTHLDKGYYTAKIWYETDVEQSFEALSTGDDCDMYVKANTGTLLTQKNYQEYDFEVVKATDSFELQILYNKYGNLKITNIEICPNLTGYKITILVIFLLLVLIDLCYLFRTNIQNNKDTLLKLIGIIILISVPLFTLGINEGHDYTFHLMRIEGLANEIKCGHIPVRISSLWMSGYGYPVSVFYGDILLYIPALLRLVGISITNVYKLYVVMINCLTVILSFIGFKGITKKDNIALIMTLAYASSGYRMMNILVRAAVGEYSAMAFLPIVAWGIGEIYRQGQKSRNDCVKISFILAFGITGIVETHVLSAEMTVLVLVVVCFVFFKKTFTKQTIVIYLMSVLETLLLNAWFLIPFMDYYFNVPVRVTDSRFTSTIIQYTGAYISQYFDFFGQLIGESSVSPNIRMALTPGFVLMMALIFGFLLWNRKEASKTTKGLTVASAALLIVASNVFPWDAIGKVSALKILIMVQFPWRYIGIATLMLALLVGSIWMDFADNNENKQRHFNYAVVIAAVVSISAVTGSYNSDAAFCTHYDTAELDSFRVMSGEYILEGVYDTSILNWSVTANQSADLTLVSENGTDMVVSCNNASADANVTFPRFNYKGYQVLDESGNAFQITDGEQMEVTCLVPAGYSGNLYLKFTEPWYWRLAEVISLLSIVGSLVLCLSLNHKTEHGEKSK